MMKFFTQNMVGALQYGSRIDNKNGLDAKGWRDYGTLTESVFSSPTGIRLMAYIAPPES
jgi:hypothetical protein